MIRLRTSLLLLILVTAVGAAAQTTWYNPEQWSGWTGSSSVAWGGGGTTTNFYMWRGQKSPSLDGASAKFFLGGSTPYTNAIWWRRLGSADYAKNFRLEFYYYMTNPAASHGFEWSMNQAVGGKRYKFSTQCLYASGIIRVWDTAGRHWVNTSVPCKRPAAYQWTKVVAEYARTWDKKVRFVAVTINGQKYYWNKYFYPENYSASAVAMHFQLDGNKYQTDYALWVDKVKVTAW